jgi:hypothetical protein
LRISPVQCVPFSCSGIPKEPPEVPQASVVILSIVDFFDFDCVFPPFLAVFGSFGRPQRAPRGPEEVPQASGVILSISDFVDFVDFYLGFFSILVILVILVILNQSHQSGPGLPSQDTSRRRGRVGSTIRCLWSEQRAHQISACRVCYGTPHNREFFRAGGPTGPCAVPRASSVEAAGSGGASRSHVLPTHTPTGPTGPKSLGGNHTKPKPKATHALRAFVRGDSGNEPVSGTVVSIPRHKGAGWARRSSLRG